MDESNGNHGIVTTIPSDKMALLSFSSNFLHDSPKNTIAKKVKFFDDDPFKFSSDVKFKFVQNKTIVDENQGCVAMFKIFDDVNIRGRIIVRKTCLKTVDVFYDRVNEDSKDNRRRLKSLNLLRLFKSKKRRFSKTDIDEKLMKPYGEALIVWSVDDWKTWKTIQAIYVHQTNDFLVYEATLKDVDDLVGVGQSIEFAACYQNDTGVFKDTNDDKCFIFERVVKEDSLDS